MLGHHAPQIGRHHRHRGRRHPVQDHRDRGAPLRGRLEELPRNRVGVPRGGGHEQPQIGCVQQLGSQSAVLFDDRIDIGGIQHGQTRGQGGLGNQLQRALIAAGHPRTDQSRQHPVIGKPVFIGRVVHQHRRSGGGTDHARLRDHPPDHGIDQGGLARTGGSSDHRQQRGRQIGQAGQHIVVQLCHDLVGEAIGGPLIGQPQR